MVKKTVSRCGKSFNDATTKQKVGGLAVTAGLMLAAYLVARNLGLHDDETLERDEVEVPCNCGRECCS